MDCSDENVQSRKRGRPRGPSAKPVSAQRRRSSSRIAEQERPKYAEQMESAYERLVSSEMVPAVPLTPCAFRKQTRGLTAKSWKQASKARNSASQSRPSADSTPAAAPGGSRDVESQRLDDVQPDIWRRPDAEAEEEEVKEEDTSWGARFDKVRDEFMKEVSLETRKSMAVYVFGVGLDRYDSVMKAYDLAAEIAGVSSRTVWNWVAEYSENGCFEPSKRGKHSKCGPWVLLDPQTREQFVQAMRELCTPKGAPNLTALDAMEYINTTLLPDLRERIRNGECELFKLEEVNETISESTALRWLHKCDFKFKRDKKGVFIDGE